MVKNECIRMCANVEKGRLSAVLSQLNAQEGLGEDNGLFAVYNQAATSIFYVQNRATMKTQRASYMRLNIPAIHKTLSQAWIFFLLIISIHYMNFLARDAYGKVES